MRLMAQSLIFLLCLATFLMAQGKPTVDSAYAQALREYQAGQFGPAAEDFQRAAKADTSDIYAQFYWGESLFKDGKYRESDGPLERTIELNKTARKLSEDQRRVVTDHLASSYNAGGDLKKLEALLNAAIRQDPRYPMNYYNLACGYAAEGNKGKVLANLRLAFQNKDRVLKGERLPDPRRDDYFREYVADSDFVALIRANGLDEGTDPEDE
jgi:predicted Zn-dependent protease